MEARRRQILTIIYVMLFTILCVCGYHLTTDKIFCPTYEAEKIVLQAKDVEVIDQASEIYYLEIEEINENYNTLLFYTNHQEVFIYSQEELIYSLQCSESMFAGTPGAKWNMITLPLDAKQLEIHVTQMYPQLAKQVPVFELGNAMNMYREVLDGASLELLLSCTIIVVGIALTLYWLLVFAKANVQKELLYLGLFAIIFGIWNFGETQFVVFMFENRAFFSYLAFTCLMTMCLPAIFFFKDFLEVEDKIIYKLFSAYIVGETLVCQVLHFTGIAGVKETANYTMVSIVLILIYLLYAIIKGLLAKRNTKKIIINIIGLLILAITAVVDMGAYYSNVLTAEKIAKIGFLIYALLLGFETTRVAREKLQEEQKMELLKEMAVKDMLTGCFNRNAFSEDCSEITDLTGMQVVGFDLNDLKKCNDTKGHKAGDAYIRDAAEVIKKHFSKMGKIYRVGGDEFCILAKNVTETEFENAKSQLQLSIAHYRLDHPDSGFGIACGLATFDPEVDKDIEDVRHRSDISMYENKKEIKK
ncbi:MAG: diguanylate cyclase [Agathobacter sp.]|nr:diguanylate cyclase [Agathobacter sp.]